MSKTETISVAVPIETAAALRKAVEIGEFGSIAEVTQAALEDWGRRRSQREKDAEELGRLWDEGIASGPPQDFEEAFSRIRQKLSEKLSENATR